MKTAELEGAALDAAVALAEGLTRQGRWWRQPGQPDQDWCEVSHFNPSSRWAVGGPILERERIVVIGDVPIEWDEATKKHATTGFKALIEPGVDYDGMIDGEFKATGRTYLVAAMRVFVHAKLGPEVTLP